VSLLSLIPLLGKVLDHVIPDPAAAAAAKQAAFDAAMKGELAYLDADVKLALGQMEINKIEAATPGIFKGGWRPFAAWACVASGVVYPILRALLPWMLQVAGVQGVPPLPPLDTTEAMTMLFGLLGLGGMRMTERLKGKA
jgi:holin (3TMs family)